MRGRLLVWGLGLVLGGGLPVVAHAHVWPSEVEKLERAARSEQPEARRRAVERLLSFGTSAADRLLPELLDDPDPEIRIMAAARAVRVRLKDTDRVIPWLTESDARLRRAAAELLEVSANARARGPLGRIIGDPDPGVRAVAVRALGRSGDPQAALTLLGRIDDPDPRVRENIAEMLALLGDTRAVVPLIGKVQDPRASVRRGVVHALGRIGDPRAITAITLALHDNEAQVQIAALEALARLRATSSVTAIIALYRKTSSTPVLEAALAALGRLGSEAALAELLEAVGKSEADLRIAAEQALALAGPRAVAALASCLEGGPLRERANGCAGALGRIDDARASPLILDALNRQVISPVVALDALAAQGTSDALPTVLAYLGSTDSSLRLRAIAAARVLLDPDRPEGRAVEPIARALDAARKSEGERVGLIELLGRTGSARANPWLAPYAGLSGEDPTRLRAIEAIGRLGGSGRARWVLPALQDESARVRLTAAVALRRIGDRALAAELIGRLERGVNQDPQALAIALSGSLRNISDPALVDRVLDRVIGSRGAVRDALIEALGHAPGHLGSAALIRLRQLGPGPAHEAKIAEMLALHPEAKAELLRLAESTVAEVRAHAVWALGDWLEPRDHALLTRLIRDPDHRVAGNAAAAPGRSRLASDATAALLCGALADPRGYVRVNALFSLRLLGRRCPGAVERDLLLYDRLSLVRSAAARLIRAVVSAGEAEAKADEEALLDCRSADRDGRVALTCERPASESAPVVTPSVSVFVVPTESAVPVAGAAFALASDQGWVRLGAADLRGALFEARARASELHLEVPAALVDFE